MKNPWDLNSDDSSQQKDTANNSQNYKQKSEKLNKNIIFEFVQKNKNSKYLKNQMNFLSLVFFIIIFLWIIQGIYKVNPDENAVVLYFGKYYQTTTPGLHFYAPYPIGEIRKASVTSIKKEDFGFSGGSDNIKSDEESLMLTGDENIADVDFEVQWKIKKIEDYLFNIKDQKNTIRGTTESVMREVIANRNIDDVLANKKFEIESTAKELLQKTLDSYGTGVEIVTVQLLRADPPKEVIDAFRDVQTAKADKERKINDAESYKNDIIPKARGESEAIIQNAESYKKSIVNKAEGETQRFNKIYNEYRFNKNITKERIYIETMEEIYKNNDKIIIDDKLNNNFIKLLDK